MRRGRREHSSMAARMLVLGWSWLLLVGLAAAASEGSLGRACRPGVVASGAAFVGQRSPQPSHQHSQQQERAARLRLYGRKKRPGGRSDGNGGGGSSGNPAGGGSRSADTSRPRPAILSTTGGATGSSGSSSSSPENIASLLSRSDKYGVLRTIEGLPEWELAGPTLATAWDRLAQRTAAAGPRAAHLPPLHLDRAFHLLVDRTWRRLPDLSPGHCASVASSLAKLRYRPEDAFLSDLLASCQAQAEGQSFGTAARLAASLARLDYDFGGEGKSGGGSSSSSSSSSSSNNELALLAGTMRERLAASELEALHPETLAMGLWALAVLGALQAGGGGGGGAGSDDLRERLLAASIARLRSAHAAAVVGVDAVVGANVLAEGKAKNLVRICRQLRTALLFLPSPPEEAGRARVAPSAQEELGRVIDEVWEDLGAWLDPVRRSRLQLEVESTLLAGGGVPAGEWGDGVVSVDIALHPRERADADGGSNSVRPVALEVDGPTHFFLNQPQRPTGDTKIKHQALHVGYPHLWAAVISVPHFEWPRLQKHRLDLLHRKLAQAGLEPAHFLAERKGHGNGGGGKEGKK